MVNRTPKPLKVGVVFDTDPTVGGSSSYARNALFLFEKLQEVSQVEFHGYVISSSRTNSVSIGAIPISYVKPMIAQSFRSQLLTSVLGVLIAKKLKLSELRLEKRMIIDGMDVAYFLSPNELSMGFAKIPIITTVWDLGHRELLGFPEVSLNHEWQYREHLYKQTLPRSVHVFVDSIHTGKKIEQLYQVHPSNWSSVGLLPTVNQEGGKNLPSITSKPYFVYPAQKWFHKNHVVLLEALSLLNANGSDIQLVFTGSDKGSGEFINTRILELDLANKVIDLGFVSQEKLNNIMANAVALLMPTFLGPTNLPPLEAALLGTRVLASDVHRFDKEDLDGIDLTLIPADSAIDWALAMQKCLLEPKSRIEYIPRNSLSKFEEVFLKLSKNFSHWDR